MSIYKCLQCDHDLVWQNDYMGSDLGVTEFESDEDFLVSSWVCPHCGMAYELHYPSEKDKLEYDFYKE